MKSSEIVKNKKAFHDYNILETLETGIVLTGNEIKSVRSKWVSIKESYIQVKDNQLELINFYIKNYQNSFSQLDEKRNRKLLAHKKEIIKLNSKVQQKGLTIIPLKMYLKNGKAKLEIALCQGKHNYDKRNALKEKQQKREIERKIKNFK